jgi:urea transport system permease protein
VIVEGLAVGAVFLLGALGLTIIYGVMGVVNLAHGEFIMLGSYTMVILGDRITTVPAIIVATLVVGALGYVADMLFIRFMYHRPVASMLGTWGVGMVIRQSVIMIFGANLRYVGLPLAGTVSLGFGVEESQWRLVLIGAGILTAVAVGLVMVHTQFGLKMRVVIGNRPIAESLGLRAERVNRGAFAFGCALAGLAGALVAPLKTVYPGMGLPYLVGAFLVVILAGLGNVKATVFWSAAIGIGMTAVAVPVNDIVAQISVWAAALLIIAFRRQALLAARV